MLPCQLCHGRRQDKLGRGLGPCFILCHDREFAPSSPIYIYIYAHGPHPRVLVYLRKTYLGPLGVVLPRPRRKPDYERLREPRGRDSGWRGPGLLIPGILLARVATPPLLF